MTRQQRIKDSELTAAIVQAEGRGSFLVYSIDGQLDCAWLP